MNAYLKKRIISRTAPLLSALQIPRIFRPFYGGMGHILMLHRVIPENDHARIHNHLSLEIDPRQLEESIQFYQKAGFQFYSLDQAVETLKAGKTTSRFVAFTFDDGYLDNFIHAYPILKKYRVPFTIYITTNFPDKKAILWWYLLEDVLLTEKEFSFQWNGEKYSFPCKTILQKEQAFSAIRRFINENGTPENFEDVLLSVFKNYQADLLKYADKMAMNWEQIRVLSEDPLCNIGAHTVNHFALKQLSEKALKFEILRSKETLEQRLNLKIEHFAYPFGKASEASHREFDMVKSLCFKTATTTRMGNIFPEHKDFLECLPRISLNKLTSKAVLNLQESGFLPFLYHKGRRVVTH